MWALLASLREPLALCSVAPSCSLLRARLSAAAFALMQQHAAARKVHGLGVSAFKAKALGGRLHQGSDCRNNAQSSAPACIDFLLVMGPSGFLIRRLWVLSSHRGLLRACLPARFAPARCSPARLRLPGLCAALPDRLFALLRAC